MTRSSHVVGDLIVTVFLDGLADPVGNGVKGFIPADPFPLSASSFSFSLQREKNPVRIGHLVDGCRAFGTVPSAASRVVRVSFQFFDLVGFFVNEGRKSTGAFAIETGGGYDLVFSLFL